MTPAEPFDISVSRVAQWRVNRRGGQVWVWESRLGAWGRIRVATSDPNIAALERLEVDGVTMWLNPDFPIRKFKIGWTPVTGLDLKWAGTPGLEGAGAG